MMSTTCEIKYFACRRNESFDIHTNVRYIIISTITDYMFHIYIWILCEMMKKMSKVSKSCMKAADTRWYIWIWYITKSKTSRDSRWYNGRDEGFWRTKMSQRLVSQWGAGNIRQTRTFLYSIARIILKVTTVYEII